MPNTNTGEKELGFKEDKIQQIFKFLEIADVSQWHGMNVFEAGDSDSLYGILLTAFEQVESHTIERAIEYIENQGFPSIGLRDYLASLNQTQEKQ
jgi:hypothetical protein